MSLTSNIKESYRYNMDINLKRLCDSHDELERKLKIADDALRTIMKMSSGSGNCKCGVGMCDCCNCADYAEEALKQIRGEK